MKSARLGPEPASAAEWQQVEVRFPFSRRAAVGPVDLVVRPGERALLLGASGSGKSTLLLTLTGLIPKSIPASVTGRIIIFGADTGSRAPWGWATRVAQYFQDADQTLCGMSVEDEIAFPLENRAMPAPGIAEAVATAMQQVGLPDAWRHRRTSTLSGGERQLVALAATLAQDAALFVTDEPTAHLAPAAARRLHALLTSRRRDRAILIVDHKLDGLVEWIDRVFVLGNEGRIVAAGHPRAVFRDAHAVPPRALRAVERLVRRLQEQGARRPLHSQDGGVAGRQGLEGYREGLANFFQGERAVLLLLPGEEKTEALQRRRV